MKIEVGKTYEVNAYFKKSLFEIEQYKNEETGQMLNTEICWRNGTFFIKVCNEDEAEELVKELIKALPNLINTKDSFAELVNKVKSPKGTTEAGLDSLNDDSFDTIIFNAIQQARNRSIEISAELKNE